MQREIVKNNYRSVLVGDNKSSWGCLVVGIQKKKDREFANAVKRSSQQEPV